MSFDDLFGKDPPNKMLQLTPPRPRKSINTDRRGRQGERDDRSPAVHAGSGGRGADTPKSGGVLDSHSRQRTAPSPGKSLAGAYRPGASARVGSLRR